MVESMIAEARPEDRESVRAAFDYSNRTMGGYGPHARRGPRTAHLRRVCCGGALDGKTVFRCFWSDPKRKTSVFECFGVSLCILDMVKLFFTVFGETPKHVFLSGFLRFCTVFAI